MVAQMDKRIDRITEAFLLEMSRITALNETETQKERHAKAWLRSTLADFEKEVIAAYERNHRPLT